MSRITRSGMVVLAMAAVLGMSACATAAGSAGNDTAALKAAAMKKQISLRVTNDNFADVDVYAYVQGTTERLTFVRSMNTEQVVVPGNALIDGQVQLVINPVGGLSSFTTDPIVVNPGETIKLTVAAALPMTNWTID